KPSWTRGSSCSIRSGGRALLLQCTRRVLSSPMYLSFSLLLWCQSSLLRRSRLETGPRRVTHPFLSYSSLTQHPKNICRRGQLRDRYRGISGERWYAAQNGPLLPDTSHTVAADTVVVATYQRKCALRFQAVSANSRQLELEETT